MTEQTETDQLKAEIRRLNMELEEVNAILDLREEELKAARRDEQAIAELYSLLSNKDIELQSLTQAMQKKQRMADAAINYQEELLGELDQVKALEKEIESLKAQIAELQSEAENSELLIMRLEKRLVTAQQPELTELQIKLEDLQLENEKLRQKIRQLEMGQKS